MSHLTLFNFLSKYLLINCTLFLLFFCGMSANAQTVTTWTLQTSPGTKSWYGVIYGNGLFVAVAYTGSGAGNRVMTSPDGIAWTLRSSAADNNWHSLAYGNGLFVAVASSGIDNRVMTSPNGIVWTSRTSAANNDWNSITYGNGLFVAVSSTGIGNRIMTSPDGINWTLQTSAADNNWVSITFGNGLFVAVAYSGSGNRVMTSPNGINWNIRNSASDNNWYSITFGNGLFVAVASSGSGNRVMTSADGITWVTRISAADNLWKAVTYGNGLFVAIAVSGAGNRVMTSPDGITWTMGTSAADNSWLGITFANGLFVSVGNTGTNRVMTGIPTILPVSLLSFTGKNNKNNNELIWQTASENSNHHFDVENSSEGTNFKKIGKVTGVGNSSIINTYQFIDSNPFSGITQYRLKQTDIDGRFKYSPIIYINKALSNLISVYPNPASGVLNIQTNNKYIGNKVQLYQIDGKLLKTIIITKIIQQINIEDLSSNIYLLMLNHEKPFKWIKK